MNGGEEGFVDLGLSVLWAKGNICKDSDGSYYVGEPTDTGCYYSWGNIVGYNIIENHIWGTSAYYGPYGSTPGYSLTGNIASNDSAHDAALACLSTGKRMPTAEEWDELYNNCTITKVTSYNGLTINGHVFKSKKTGYTDKEIFIPMAGFGYKNNIYSVGEYSYYWSSTAVNNGSAFGMYADSGGSTGPQYRIDKYYGCPVRAVMDK